MKRIRLFFQGMGILLSLILMMACAGNIPAGGKSLAYDGKYDIIEPFGENAAAIERLMDTVHMISVTAYYVTYTFPFEDRIRNKDLTEELLNSGKYKKGRKTKSSVGTSALIYSEQNRAAVITCAHVIDFPDTIHTYYKEDINDTTLFLYQIGIKIRQQNYVADLPQGGGFKPLAVSKEMDIAILGKQFVWTPERSKLPVLSLPVGTASELTWGNRVFLIGFPAGKRMLTTGLVSQPRRNKRNDFLIDANFNRGSSGSLVLAIRDGIPNFELVGIANAVAAEDDLVLQPDSEYINSQEDYLLPYKGPILVGPKKSIKYGITFGIGIDGIMKFIEKNRDTFENAGFKMAKLFKSFPTN